LIDTASWHLTIEEFRGRFWRLYDLWKILMVGEAFNIATPLGTMSGELIKAALLKNVLDIICGQGIASLVFGKDHQSDCLASLSLHRLRPNSAVPAVFFHIQIFSRVGLPAFSPGITSFFCVQRFFGLTQTGGVFFRTQFGKPLLKWFDGMKSFEHELLLF
jgi:hypothetical protein